MAPKKKEKKEKKGAKKIETKTKSGSKSFNVCSLVISVIVLGATCIGYQYYVSFTTLPEMPKLELDTWWGPNLQATQDTSIRPYRVLFTSAMQENIQRKFDFYRSATRVKSLNESFSYGVHSDALAQIFAHWQFKYSFRARAKYLNMFNHYKTNIQGLDIHYIRVKPEVEANVKVLPILLLHGWPSSIREFYDVIPSLTSAQPGYDFVFEVIAPSLPGFIFSQGAVRPGFSTVQISIVLRNLMERLGIHQFYVHGGDIGHIIGSHMATIFPNQVLGFHTSFPVHLSKRAHFIAAAGAYMPKFISNLSDIVYPTSQKFTEFLEESGYLHLQATKPDTIGIALQDSPIGLAAYIIDRIAIFTNPNNRNLVDGGLFVFNTTDLLDNIMLYWTSGSITTALRLYKENILNYELEDTLARIPTTVPTWGLRPKHELVHHPKCILKNKYPNLVGITKLDDGGHFVAMEKPNEVSDDIFKAVKNFLIHSKNK